MKITTEGKSNIKATIICHSISGVAGKEIVTFELEYPRIIHSEVMTHRVLSRNAASSRAIPFEKMCEQLNGKPVRFGSANKGMQDLGEEHTKSVEVFCEETQRWQEHSAQDAWDLAKAKAQEFASYFYEANYHKQVYNRLLEPFQIIKVVVTATEWNNFFWLRDDVAADPTLQELARCMREAKEKSVPVELYPGEWHLPYVQIYRDVSGILHYYDTDSANMEYLSTEDAQIMSAARSAAVSFRNIEYDLEKCKQVFLRLVGDERKHASAFEHQATPMAERRYTEDILDDVNVHNESATWQDGITHVDRAWQLWSGNFRGWIQHRQLIDGHNKEG